MARPRKEEVFQHLMQIYIKNEDKVEKEKFETICKAMRLNKSTVVMNLIKMFNKKNINNIVTSKRTAVRTNPSTNNNSNISNTSKEQKEESDEDSK